MEIPIFHSILFGELKPWLEKNRDNKFFGAILSQQFVSPNGSINNYYQELKNIYPKCKELFTESGLEIYLLQPSNDSDTEITLPLVKLNLPFLTPRSAIERFYFALIQNESIRVSNNIFQAVGRKIDNVDRVYIVNTYKSYLVSLLKNIADIKAGLNQDDPNSIIIIEKLKQTVVRLIAEMRELYAQYDKGVPIDKNQIFAELLNEEIPDGDLYKKGSEMNNLLHILKEVKTGLPLKKRVPDNAFSFKVNCKQNLLREAIVELNDHVDLLNLKTDADTLLQVLTSEDLSGNATPIFLACSTKSFAYILKGLKPHFSNLNPKTIEDSTLFRSKDHPEKILKAQTLYSSNTKDSFPEKEAINKILKKLQ